MRFGIIVNPAAGLRSAVRLRQRLEAFCRCQGFVAEIAIIESTVRLEEVACRMASCSDMLGVVGGDGTLNGAVNGLLASDAPETPVAFFPAGRGADIARTLSSWHPRMLDSGRAGYRLRQVDVGIAESTRTRRFFVNETSLGLGALAAQAALTLPRQLGTSAYLAGTVRALLRGRAFRARLRIEGGPWIELDRCHHLTLANGRYFGGGLQVAPPANPEDGMLEIVAVADISASEIARALPRLFRATHLGHPGVRHWRATKIHIETMPEALAESDGEVWESTPTTFSVANDALTWVEPV